MKRLPSLSLLKAQALFYIIQLQKLEYFDGALKWYYQFLKVLQKICNHYRLFVDNVHAISLFHCLASYYEKSKLPGSSYMGP